MTIQLRPISFTDREALIQAYELENSATREARGDGWTPLPAEVRLQRWTNQPGFTYALVGAWQESELVGLGQRCSWEKEPEDHFVEVAVEPAYRLRGIGRGLLDMLESGAGPYARRFVSEPFLPDRPAMLTLVDGFCARTGYALGSVEVLQETTLQDATIPVADPVPGWQLHVHVDGLPDAMLPEVGVIQGLVDEQAPSGDIEWHAHPVTPEEYREDLATVVAEGSHLVEAVVTAPDGRVAGWTALTTAVTPDRPAQVVATLVLEEFRGHGLGMALKSAVARRALELGVTRLTTQSDQANTWMLEINRRQGFLPAGIRACLHKQLRRCV